MTSRSPSIIRGAPATTLRPWSIAGAAMLCALLGWSAIRLESPSSMRAGAPDAFDGPVSASIATGEVTEVMHGERRAFRAQIDAAVAWLGALGMRNVIVCRPAGNRDDPPFTTTRGSHVTGRRCDGSTANIVAAAEGVASASPQAVIFDGTTADAVIFIEALRARGSFAMVVAASSVDGARLAHTLSPAAKKWLAAVDGAETSATASDRVRIGMLAASGRIIPASGPPVQPKDVLSVVLGNDRR